MLSTTQINTLQIVIVGAQAVGKTCLIKTYCDGKFDPHSVATVPMEMSEKIIEIDGSKIKLRIIEGKMPNDRMFINTKPFLMQPLTKAIVLMCDLSTQDAEQIYQTEIVGCLKEIENSNLIKVIVGCKADLAIEGNEEILRKIASDNEIYYESVSAKNGEVENLFNNITNNIVKASLPSLANASFLANNHKNRQEDAPTKEMAKSCILS